MRVSRLLFVVIACSAMLACDDEAIEPGSSEYHAGALGNGGFAYQCDDSVVCGHSNAAEQFPERVAVGSKFKVRYVAADPYAENAPKVATLKAVGEDVLTVSPAGGFEAIGPGWSSIVAYDAQGRVVEFFPLAVAEPDSLAVFDSGSQPVDSFGKGTTNVNPPLLTVQMKKGESRLVSAVARTKGRPLAGALPYEWKSSDPSVAAIDYDLMQRVNVRAMGHGAATISVQTAGLSATIDIEVE